MLRPDIVTADMDARHSDTILCIFAMASTEYTFSSKIGVSFVDLWEHLQLANVNWYRSRACKFWKEQLSHKKNLKIPTF